MLEALIRVKPGVNGHKRQGDVICVKLAGSVWGREEVKVHQRVAWEDASLEAELQARQRKGEAHPVIVAPYQETQQSDVTNDAGEKVATTTTIKTRSRRWFDVASIADERLRRDILDPAVEVKPGRLPEQALLQRKTKSDVEVEQEYEANKTTMATIQGAQ